jgi:hypothetical protein
VVGLKSDREEFREVTQMEATEFAKNEYNTMHYEISGRQSAPVFDLIEKCLERFLQLQPPQASKRPSCIVQ